MSEATKAAVAESLDEQYGDDPFCVAFALQPSKVIREDQPTTFRCLVADYTGTSDDLYEIEGEYYNRREVDKAAEDFIDGMDSRLTDIEEELDDLEIEDLPDNEGRIIELRQEIAELTANIDACSRHTF